MLADHLRDGLASLGLPQRGLGLSDGRDFGAPGYLRLNFGCSRATLAEACLRLERAHAAAGRPDDESGPAT